MNAKNLLISALSFPSFLVLYQSLWVLRQAYQIQVFSLLHILVPEPWLCRLLISDAKGSLISLTFVLAYTLILTGFQEPRS